MIIASGDGTGNTTAPVEDPGWHEVGRMGSLNAVYLGRGWVITARHVAQVTGFFAPDRQPQVRLAGETHPAVKGSGVELRNSDGSRPDLLLLRIEGAPDLSLLPLAEHSPAPGTPVLLVGRGREREPERSYWDESFRPATRREHVHAGFRWAPGARRAKRWGTNVVHRSGMTFAQGGTVTRALSTVFDDGGSAHEAQAARGDSGGAVFAWTGGRWVLAGVLVSVGEYPGQHEMAVFGNVTIAADLAAYREQILAAVAAGDAAP